MGSTTPVALQVAGGTSPLVMAKTSTEVLDVEELGGELFVHPIGPRTDRMTDDKSATYEGPRIVMFGPFKIKFHDFSD
ncbi:MAG: hypothetical protein IPK04_12125 [Bdellovibrionales bacterium]|nr:hypothetical protein [Bdellovibrionales bacterium]